MLVLLLFAACIQQSLHHHQRASYHFRNLKNNIVIKLFHYYLFIGIIRNYFDNFFERQNGDVMKCRSWVWTCCCCCNNILVVNCCWMVCQNKIWSARQGVGMSRPKRFSISGFRSEKDMPCCDWTIGSCTAEMMLIWSAFVSGLQESVSEWVRMWALKLQAKAKHFPHCEQLWGFFPIHKRKVYDVLFKTPWNAYEMRYRLIYSYMRIIRPTIQIMNFLKIIPVWRKRWFLKFVCLLKPRLHILHWKGQLPLCTYMCDFKSPGVGNDFWHIVHLWGFSW